MTSKPTKSPFFPKPSLSESSLKNSKWKKRLLVSKALTTFVPISSISLPATKRLQKAVSQCSFTLSIIEFNIIVLLAIKTFLLLSVIPSKVSTCPLTYSSII